ncbi:MAG: hypothetical protein K5924_00520 [Chloroflexi bacterium]|nr:hypothetical protein [Chloroflexota bacterium]
MTQTMVVTRLAVRELWMSFRLIVLLGAYLGAGAIVAFLPAAPSVVLERLAVALAMATVAGSATAAWSLSNERALGRVGWLAARSIERPTILAGWFLALSALTAAGLVGSAMLGWAAAGGPAARVDGAAFAWSVAGIGCGALALIALGLTAGSILAPRPATVTAATGAAILIGVGWLALPSIATPPEVLSLLPRLDRPVSVALQSAGAALAVAVLLLGVASAALSRVDL